MKKIFMVFTIALATLVLVACSGKRNQAPEITISEDLLNPVIQQGETYNPLDGVTASDEEDGNLTSAITVSGFTEDDVNFPGTYTIVLRVTDSGGLFDSVTINLTVESEFSAPVFNGVVEQQTYFIGSGAWSPLTGVTASDSIDGNLTEDIQVLSQPGVDYFLDQVGVYEVRLRVENSNGVRATATIILSVVLTDIPLSLPTTPITIEFWHASGSENQGVIADMITSFKAKYATLGYNFNVNQTAYGGYAGLYGAMVPAVTTRTFPHVVMAYPDHVATYKNSPNTVLNITPYITHEMWGMGDGESEKLSDIVESYREENSQYDATGNYYSLPFNKSTEIFFYNKTLLEELELEVPATWQDLFEDVAPAVKVYGDAQIEATVRALPENAGKSEQELAPIIAQEKLKVIPVTYDSSANFFITAARQWGGAYTAVNPTTYKGQYLWNTNANTKAAMEYFKANDGYINTPAYWGVDYGNEVPRGYTFMSIGSTAGIKYNIPPVDDLGEPLYELGIAPVPYNADKPENRAVIQQGTNLSVLNRGSAAEKLVAFLFIKHMSSKEMTMMWSMRTGYAPVRYSAYEDPIFVEFLENPTPNQKYFSMAVNATLQSRQYFFFDPAFNGSSRARDQVGLAMDRIMHGDGNVQSALDEAYTESNLSGQS